MRTPEKGIERTTGAVPPGGGGERQTPAAGGTTGGLFAWRRRRSWLVCMHWGCVPLREYVAMPQTGQRGRGAAAAGTGGMGFL